MNNKRFLTIAFSLIAFVVGAASVRAETIYGITSNTPVDTDPTFLTLNLVRFDSATPSAITTIGPITGIKAGHTLRSIDFRPINNVLYGISTGNNAGAGLPTYADAQLYTINVSTGVATPLGAGFVLTSATGAPNNDPRAEIEFNPVTDRIRILTAANVGAGGNPFGANNNFRADPNTGALISTDSVLAYAPGDPNAGAADVQIVAAAYTNPAAGQTTLYAWDLTGDDLVTVGSINGTPDSPNSGLLHTINTPASPGYTFNPSAVGMDISPNTGTLYATLVRNTFGNPAGLYTRNLTTGAITLLGNYPAGTFVSDISVPKTLTAAGVTVAGRVTSDGRTGLRGATVTITDQSGNSRSTTTALRGSFTFEDVELGQSYTVTVFARRYTFEPQVIVPTDSVADMTFTPENNLGRKLR